MRPLRARQLMPCAWCLLLGVASVLAAQTEPATLTTAQMQEFLLTAQITHGKQAGKGVTLPWRLTLTNGTLTHDALFQTIDERKSVKKFDGAKTELNFVDSYHYNIAAFGIAELLGLESMTPVAVERQWDGKTGSLIWWIDDVAMDEQVRLKKKIRPPDPDGWNKQFYRMRVFSQLVYDTDRNLTNVLITNDWKVWMIDFSRAFRLWPDLQSEKDLNRCDRALLAKLRELTEAAVREKTAKHLSESEVKAVMSRRDKIIQHYDRLIAERGEEQVLF